jgi:hypothetical protein
MLHLSSSSPSSFSTFGPWMPSSYLLALRMYLLCSSSRSELLRDWTVLPSYPTAPSAAECLWAALAGTDVTNRLPDHVRADPPGTVGTADQLCHCCQQHTTHRSALIPVHQLCAPNCRLPSTRQTLQLQPVLHFFWTPHVDYYGG